MTPSDINEQLICGVVKVAVSERIYTEASEEEKKELLLDAFEDGDIDDLLGVDIVVEVHTVRY